MEFYSLLFLLLPFAAFSGWWMAVRNQRKAQSLIFNRYQKEYLAALKYLVDDQPDKAIQIFTGLVEVDKDTIELHEALGNLFRQRGEVEKAIQIHQNLITKAPLQSGLRSQAIFSLAEDYMRAGLFDRAEALYLELLESGVYKVPSLNALIDIYERERDWTNAINFCQQLERATDKSLKTVQAHYYCELAQEVLNREDPTDAQNYLEQSILCDPNCLRGFILSSELSIQINDYPSAIKMIQLVLGRDPSLFPLVKSNLKLCYQMLGTNNAYQNYLQSLLEIKFTSSVLLELTIELESSEGVESALKYLTDHLRHNPTLAGLSRLIELNTKLVQPAQKNDFQILSELIGSLSKGQPAYKCHNCGFTATNLHWQCPSCKRWNSVTPVATK